MTPLLLTIAILAIALWLSLMVFYVFPATMASVLRYKLWPIRDELADALIDSEFSNPDQPELLVREVELVIANAEELRPLNLLVLMALARGKRPPITWEFDLAKADEADRPRLASIHRRFMSAAVRHFLIGSWSGLITLIFVLPVAILVAVLRGRTSGDGSSDSMVQDVKDIVRNEISVKPALKVLAGRPNVKELSASV
jgi:hypothetical protein